MTRKATFATVAAPTARGDEPSMLISTIGLDRDQDVIVPEGAHVSSYLKNPVVGWQHFRHDSMPVGTTTRLDVEPGRGIRATWRWLENDPLASRVKNAFEQGILRAASIGFLPTAWEPIPGTSGRRYTEWEFLEWSLTPLPSNPDAVRVLREFGLWGDDERGADIVVELADDEPVVELDDRDATTREWLRGLQAKAHRQTMQPAVRAGLIEPELHISQEGLRELDHLLVSVTRQALRETVDHVVLQTVNRLRGRLD